MAKTALEVIERIRHKSRERDYCLAVLELWAQVQAQGIDPEAVDAFGFDSKLLTGKDKRAYQQSSLPGGGPGGQFMERRRNGSYRMLLYNYVRLKDGTTQSLNPMLKAVYHCDDND